jgi:hypothetical protein
MSRTSAFLEDFWIDAVSIVSHTQGKLGVTVGYFRFNFAGVGVLKRVSQGLTGNPVNFIAKEGIELPLRSLDEHPQRSRPKAVVGTGEFFTQTG